MSRIVLCLSHSIEESDQLALLTELGHEVVSIGGFINPQAPHDQKRPPLPNVPYFPEVQRAVDALGTNDNLGAAQSRIPDAILEWLGDDGILIYHHYLERLFGQWDRIRDWKRGASGRRVIWRSVGQSVEYNEREAVPFRREGLERVAYSPKEANIPGYSGRDALIRFYKDPDEWQGWTGEWLLDHNDLGPIVGADKGTPFILNFTQHLAQREPYTNYGFWHAATQGLPAVAAGPGSEEIGGLGEQSFEMMQKLLRGARAYLYTGTQPASYTLGLIEAMMTGIPVVSIGPSWMRIFPYGPDLFEGHDIVHGNGFWSNDPAEAQRFLVAFLNDHDYARSQSVWMRSRAIELFGKQTIAAQWAAFLGSPAEGQSGAPTLIGAAA
jgi:glycosyltransferase involved in cell wall biosynthesis